MFALGEDGKASADSSYQSKTLTDRPAASHRRGRTAHRFMLDAPEVVSDILGRRALPEARLADTGAVSSIRRAPAPRPSSSSANVGRTPARRCELGREDSNPPPGHPKCPVLACYTTPQ